MKVTDEMVKVTDAMTRKQAVIEAFRKVDPAFYTASTKPIHWDVLADAAIAALAVAPDPAPDDAEFEKSLGQWAYALRQYDRAITEGEPNDIKYCGEKCDETFQRILALHAQATHAGLRELRETLWMEQLKPSMSAVGSGYAAGVAAGVANGLWWAMGQIDAMLTEATDDR